jgi:hypothetical protein
MALVCLLVPSVWAEEPVDDVVKLPPRVSYETRPLQELAPDVVNFLADREGLNGVAVAVPALGVVYATNGRTPFHMASVAKLTIMLTLLDQAAQAGADLTPYQKALVEPMIVLSYNDGATFLWEEVGGGDAIASYLQSVKVEGITPDPEGAWGASTATPEGIAILLSRLIQGQTLDERYREFAKSLLGQVHPDERWGALTGVPEALPENWTIGVKDGWYQAESGWWVNSVGFFLPGDDILGYTLAVMTNEQPAWEYGEETVDTVSRMLHHHMLPYDLPYGEGAGPY